MNWDGKININAYLLSDNNEISIKVVVFEGEDKTVMSRRTEYGRKIFSFEDGIVKVTITGCSYRTKDYVQQEE